MSPSGAEGVLRHTTLPPADTAAAAAVNDAQGCVAVHPGLLSLPVVETNVICRCCACAGGLAAVLMTMLKSRIKKKFQYVTSTALPLSSAPERE